MLRIRLRRVGKKKQPMYRIVVADSRSPRDGAFVESLGYYQPLDDPSTIVLDQERARHWLERGAQPSDRVAKLLAVQGIADLPPKLVARMQLGKQRAKETAAEKAKAKATEAPAAVATAEPAAEAEAPAEPEPAAEASEEPSEQAEAPDEEPSEAAGAEAPAEEEAAEG